LDDMLQTLFDGRYIVLLMGIFAMYCGFLYNEVFAIPMSLFPSQWSYEGNNTNSDFIPNVPPYLIGVDPKWKNAENNLYFFNSLKMKMSIIIGVTQMFAGIILSAFNAYHFKKPYNFFFEFVPQMIFMGSTFGYMVVLIFYKWCINWRGDGAPSTLGGTGPPSILNLMIAMFLSPKLTPDPEYYMYHGQGYIQLVFIFLAVICVPIMLFAKPTALYYENKRAKKAKFAELPEEEQPLQHEEVSDEKKSTEPAKQQHGGGGHGEHGGEFEMSEVMVHQSIHTIEFVLGAVSNTASYLRLWALSLAHAELSEVFMNMVLINMLSLTQIKTSSATPTQPEGVFNIGYLQFLLIFVGFAVWAALTIAVLLLMEALSAFLHALRLHWVEFQNKFYMGDGYKFAPFSYQAILALTK